jgi:hypothetical protein
MAMKILTQAIINAFKKQGKTGNKEAKDIFIICKLFNPYGAGTWYLYEQEDEDIYWAFVNLGDRECAECGPVSMSELLSMRVPPFRMPLERDKFFEPFSMTLEEVQNKVKAGQHV